MLNGEEMRRVRLSRDLSQKDISDAIKVNIRIIGAWERSEREPSEKDYEKWLKAVYSLDKEQIKSKKTK